MGVVSEYLHEAIAGQIKLHKLVVWYDPEKHYTELAGKLDMPGVTLARYQGSFIGLRYEIDHLMEDNEPPRLLVYVPLAREACSNALIELEVAGVVMRPNQQPPERNTRLANIALNALRSRLGQVRSEEIERQVEAGQLNLAELDKLAEQEVVVTSGVLTVIFNTLNPGEIALNFLVSNSYDAQLTSRNAQPELVDLLRQVFEVDLPPGETLNAIRARLARHVLLTEFIGGLSGILPDSLASVKLAGQPATAKACMDLARLWRQQRSTTFRESYAEYAMRVETDLKPATLKLKAEQLGALETFLYFERVLQTEVETALLNQPEESWLELGRRRQSGFWSEQNIQIRLHWDLIISAGQVLLEAQRIEQELKTAPRSASSLFEAYTRAEKPWCLLDTYYRHMERRYYNFDFEQSARYEGLHALVNRARQRYMLVGGDLAEAFVRSYQQDHFKLPGELKQIETYEKIVKPATRGGKTAYIWVDALRYEMGRELAETLREDFSLELKAAVATVPTITEIGMAALLPEAHTGVEVVPDKAGKLALKIGNNLLKDRQSRLKFLTDRAGINVVAIKLEDLFPTPKPRLRDTLRSAQLALVTSQEIDDIGEGSNIAQARRRMDETLLDLKRAFRQLAELGFQTIVFTADHGFLFGDEINDAMKIEPPKGETLDLHRRVWVGRGGASSPSYMRAKLEDFGMGGGLEIAAPWNFAIFSMRGGGSSPYFHGGLSPQELIIPVATLTKVAAGGTSDVSGVSIKWELVPGSQKLTTRFFSVQVKGAALFEIEAPTVRVEIRSGRDREALSMPVSASYGFEEATGDVRLQVEQSNRTLIEPNTITLMMTKDPPQKTVTLHLLDATTNVELCQSDPLPVDIAI